MSSLVSHKKLVVTTSRSFTLGYVQDFYFLALSCWKADFVTSELSLTHSE